MRMQMKHAHSGGPNDGEAGWEAGDGAWWGRRQADALDRVMGSTWRGGGRSSTRWEAGGNATGSRRRQIRPPRLRPPDPSSSSPATTRSRRERRERRRARRLRGERDGQYRDRKREEGRRKQRGGRWREDVAALSGEEAAGAREGGGGRCLAGRK